MISADTSSLIAYFANEASHDVEKIDEALANKTLILAPVVVTELLSSRRNAEQLIPFLVDIPLFDFLPGYWWRAGETRRRVLEKRLKARTADALIAQCCIDADTVLIAHDHDFRHFANLCGLKLA